MKRNFLRRSALLPVFLFFLAGSAAAAAAEAGEADNKIVFGFDGLARVRYEYLLNNADAGYSGKDERSYFRFKFSGGVNASYGSFASAYMRLSTESRSYIKNAGRPAEYDINETVIDNLYLLFPDIFGAVEIKIGRMDLKGAQYAEGFLLEDGTPLDGSRTVYFDAAKIKYRALGALNADIELLLFRNEAFDGMPVINAKEKRLNSGGETGAALWGRVNARENLYLEPYYVWKKADKAAADKFFARETLTNALGSFARYKLDNLTVRAQAAFQFGEYGGEAAAGCGGYLFADYAFGRYFKPQAGIVYLSGDDAGTKKKEGWDPLFSRSSYLSEIAASLYGKETGYACWTNLLLYNIEAQSKLSGKLILKAAYTHMKANERAAAAGGIFGKGKTRGELFSLKASYDFSEKFRALALGEYFMPGDFYYDGAKDAVFVRFETVIKL